MRKGQGKRQGKLPSYHLKGGAGRECVDGKAKNQSSTTNSAMGDEAKLYHRKREDKESHSSVPQSEQP